MDFSQFLDCLAVDFARLRSVAPVAPAAAVPSCPGWTVADLTRHVGVVYLHKTVAMREGAEPDPWPPKEVADEEPLALLDRAYAGLREEFAARKPEDPTGTWYAPDALRHAAALTGSGSRPRRRYARPCRTMPARRRSVSACRGGSTQAS